MSHGLEMECWPNWASQLSSLQPMDSWKFLRQAVKWPGLQRSTMKCPRDVPAALTLWLYSKYASCICNIRVVPSVKIQILKAWEGRACGNEYSCNENWANEAQENITQVKSKLAHLHSDGGLPTSSPAPAIASVCNMTFLAKWNLLQNAIGRLTLSLGASNGPAFMRNQDTCMLPNWDPE